MSDNMNNTEQLTETENIGGTEVQEPATGKTSGERRFTQEEVNSFVKSQVGRMVGKAIKDQEAVYNQKMQELQQREMNLLVKEQLDARGMPRELADVITCTDEDDLKNKLDALQKIYGGSTAGKEKPTGFTTIGAANNPDSHKGTDPVRKAMGLE